MAIYAIGDMHLSLGSNKPMDVFYGWEGYLPKLEKNWREQIAETDTVVLDGDTSWAMKLEDARADFAFLQKLPGQKWLVKGNHDYWWTTCRKMETFFEENGFSSLHIINNNCCITQGVALCGTRGWPFDQPDAQDTRLMAREAGRLRLSLQAGGELPKLVFLHYPPVYPGSCAQELLEVMQEFGVKHCWYGHLHGKYIRYAFEGERDGIDYRLISADGLNFCPCKILDNEG